MRLKIFLLVCLVAEIYSDDREEEPELGVQPAIIGGHNAHPDQFPYLVAIYRLFAHPKGHFGIYRCVGAIIDARWILTAGHCYMGEPLFVKAGKNDITKKENNEQIVRVKKLVIHNGYHKESIKNDIALLLLEHPLALNHHVSKIDLPARGSEPAGHGILSGWGVTHTHQGAKHASTLQTLKLPVLDHVSCNKFAQHLHQTFTNSQFCAKGSRGVGGCAGDSGGPFVVEKHGGHKEVAGIFSWGVFPCGTKDALDVFTKVSAYVDWIHTVMGQHK